MKKVMATMFVAFMVIVSMGMGQRVALADTYQPALKQRVVEARLVADEQRFADELVRFEDALVRYGNTFGDVEQVGVEHFVYHGMDDCSFVMFAIVDGEPETSECVHVTHDDIERSIVMINAYAETQQLGDWM